MKYKWAMFISLLIGMMGCTDRKNEKSNSSIALVREIEKIRLIDLNGKPISVSQYKGKTIFINFWATWCKPCIKEMPYIEVKWVSANDQIW